MNTVLFPGTPIHLHIFEERYKRMIEGCIANRSPFGVALIRRGAEALGPLAEPHSIGCTARIVHVQRLEQGRLNIVGLGQERFRILSTQSHLQPYLVATVDSYPLEVHDPFALEPQADGLRVQVERLVQILADAGGSAGGSSFDLNRLPEDPVSLAYMAAAVLQIAPQQKQALLEAVDAAMLLEQVRTAYRRELALARVATTHAERDSGSAFSRN